MLPAETTPGCSRMRSRMVACCDGDRLPGALVNSAPRAGRSSSTTFVGVDAQRHPRHLRRRCGSAAPSPRAARMRARLPRRRGPGAARRVSRELPRSPALQVAAPACRRTSTSDGTSPNTIVMPATSASARPSTRPLTAASARRGTSTGVTATMSGSATSATSRPATRAGDRQEQALGEQLRRRSAAARRQARCARRSRARATARASAAATPRSGSRSRTAGRPRRTARKRRPVVAELIVEQRHDAERPAFVAAVELAARAAAASASAAARACSIDDAVARAAPRASMKCALRLCCVRSHCSRCHTSTSSGKWKPGGITPTTVYGVSLRLSCRPMTPGSAP